MGKIGKPQKSKRHKKIKAVDPFYKGNRVADKNTLRYNEAPISAEDQEIPRSVRELMKGVQDAKHMKKKRKKQNHPKIREESQGDNMEKGMTKPLKPVPIFKQGKNEPDEAFLNRIERETQTVIARAQYEDKYKVDLDKQESGQQSTKKKKKKKPQTAERLKNLKEKQMIKKGQKIEKKFLGFEHLQDDIKFGEVADEPPTFSAKPRKSQDIKSKKAGSKSLLLKDIIEKQSEGISKPKTGPPKREMGKTVKRKHLPPVQQVMLDAEREKAIERYREMKAKKMKKS